MNACKWKYYISEGVEILDLVLVCCSLLIPDSLPKPSSSIPWVVGMRGPIPTHHCQSLCLSVEAAGVFSFFPFVVTWLFYQNNRTSKFKGIPVIMNSNPFVLRMFLLYINYMTCHHSKNFRYVSIIPIVIHWIKVKILFAFFSCFLTERQTNVNIGTA